MRKDACFGTESLMKNQRESAFPVSEEGNRTCACTCFRHISIDMVVCHLAAPEDSNKQMSLSTYDIKGLAGVMGIGTASLRIYTQLKILIV